MTTNNGNAGSPLAARGIHLSTVQSAKSAGAQGKKPSGARGGASGGTGTFAKLADLYLRMEKTYDDCATTAGLTCKDCETNCCTSYFQHHTYVEWIYLWKGLNALPAARRNVFIQRAHEYTAQAREAVALNALPSAMCPLNESGLCALYAHRLMICRMHGTRNVLTLPDTTQRFFPGCERFTSLTLQTVPTLDRTPFYQELATLEMQLYQRTGVRPPRVNLTLAEMITQGPPKM